METTGIEEMLKFIGNGDDGEIPLSRPLVATEKSRYDTSYFSN